MNIRKGFILPSYAKSGGDACLVRQPNGNYIVITHDAPSVDWFPKTLLEELEYVGDFVNEEYYITNDYETDPNIQAKNVKYWKNSIEI